jgi:hypothetical protein
MYSFTFYINYAFKKSMLLYMYKLISLIFLVLLFVAPYFCVIESNTGHPKSHIDQLIKTLREISIDLSYNINEEDGKLLRKRLQNTSFMELKISDHNVLAWNYDKGREIAVDIFDKQGNPYSADNIITSLLHELAHSLTDSIGHGPEWVAKNNYLQGFKDKYVPILIKKTFIKK